MSALAVGSLHTVSPDATYRVDGRTYPAHTTVRGEAVRVERGPDSDGDYAVRRVVDGRGFTYDVSPEHLTPVTLVPAAPDVVAVDTVRDLWLAFGADPEDVKPFIATLRVVAKATRA